MNPRVVIFFLVLLVIILFGVITSIAQSEPTVHTEYIHVESKTEDPEDQKEDKTRLNAVSLWELARDQRGDELVETLELAAKQGHKKAAQELVRLNQWYGFELENEFVQLWKNAEDRELQQLWLFAQCNALISRQQRMIYQNAPEEKTKPIIERIKQAGAMEPALLMSCALFLERYHQGPDADKDKAFFTKRTLQQCQMILEFYEESEVDAKQARINMGFAAIKQLKADVLYGEGQFNLALPDYEDACKRAKNSGWLRKAYELEQRIKNCKSKIQEP